MTVIWKRFGAIVRCACAGAYVLMLTCAPTQRYVTALESDDANARYEAARELQRVGPKGAGALPALMVAAEQGDAELRRLAVEAIGNMGRKAWKANVVLTHACGDDDVHVRRAAVVALGNLHKFPTSAFPCLLACLGDSDSLVREFAINTFEDLGSNGIGTLCRGLADSSVTVRRSAAMTLCRLGGEARFAASALRRACRDEDGEVSRLADEALKQASMSTGQN